jgi:hypothetical protein
LRLWSHQLWRVSSLGWVLLKLFNHLLIRVLFELDNFNLMFLSVLLFEIGRYTLTGFLYLFLWDPALDLASTLRLHRYLHLLGQHHILPLDLLETFDQELILVLRLMESLLDGLDLVVSLLDDLPFSKLCGLFVFETLLCLDDI